MGRRRGEGGRGGGVRRRGGVRDGEGWEGGGVREGEEEG